MDRFRERIMLPIRRPDGGIVGFIGRAAPGASPDVSKYLNTTTTAAFTKGDVLFGLAEQSEMIGRVRTLIVDRSMSLPLLESDLTPPRWLLAVRR